jgi:hypothetical protein
MLSRADAARVQALDAIEQLVQAHPGLLDGEEEVNGADVVEYLTHLIAAAPALKQYLGGE